MQTKLTLRLEEDLIRRAKRASARTGKSVSQMVGDFFRTLEQDPAQEELSPRVKALLGVLPPSVCEEDWRTHLEEKHQ